MVIAFDFLCDIFCNLFDVYIFLIFFFSTFFGILDAHLLTWVLAFFFYIFKFFGINSDTPLNIFGFFLQHLLPLFSTKSFK